MSPTPFASVLPPVVSLLRRLTKAHIKEPKITLGLDIGSTAVKVLAAGGRKASGVRTAVGQKLITLKPGQETDASEAIRSCVSGMQQAPRTVNLSVSGQWVIIRVVEMPSMKAGEMKQALPFEAQRYLPFDIKDVVIDGVALGPADANKMWVLVVACKRELLDRRIDWVRRAGLDVGLIDVDALAVANGFLATCDGSKAEGTHVLINVGSQFTNLIIVRSGVPYLVRDIPWGGEKLVRSASEHMGRDAESVEKQIREAHPSPECLEAIKIMCEPLVSELQLSFDYFENRFGQAPEDILVTGGMSLSACFIEALKSHLAQPVSQWSPISGLSGQFTVAYGLALRTG